MVEGALRAPARVPTTKKGETAVLFLLDAIVSHVLFFILHVTGAGAFPRPLTAKEERDCLARLQNGDPAARAELIERNLRLVAHMVKKYYAASGDQDDLISIGTIGLIKAVHTFQPEKCPSLGAYAAKCVENEIRMFLRSSKKLKNEVSLESPIGTDPVGNTVALMDVLGTDGDYVMDEVGLKLETEELTYLLGECLDERELFVVKMRYGLDGGEAAPQWEIAKKLNISRSYVSRIEKRALEKLRERLDGGGDG